MDYSVTNKYPYNIYQNYGYFYSPFYGVQQYNQQNVQNTAQVSSPSQIPRRIPPDTVELSKNNQVKEKEEQNSILKNFLWMFGIAGFAGVAFLTHKIVHPKRIQKEVQSIFLENFSKKDSLKIQQKYLDILKIKDKDEFIDKTVEALRKDYKLEDIPIKVDKTFKSGTESGAIQAAAHMSPQYEKGYILVGVDKTRSEQDLLKSLVHEFRHIKQDKLGHQVVTEQELKSIMTDRYNDAVKFMKKTEECTASEEDIIEATKNPLNFYKKLGIKPLSKNDKNYEWARKIIESYRTYANKSKEAYHNTFYETDAHSAGSLMTKMINHTLL